MIAVELRGVGLTYPGPPPVIALQRSDLTIRRGEHVTVVGPSGSGKSTFLNIVGLLDRPTSGHYELDGVDVGSLKENERAALRGKRIGFVFQSFHLMGRRSAIENVGLAQLYSNVPATQRHRAAMDALDSVGLGHRAHAFPSTLSGGERQRVAIARALVNRPSLLLCDEPTGSLDSANAEAVLSLIDDVQRDGLTIVTITHDRQVAARGDRVLTIHDGKING